MSYDNKDTRLNGILVGLCMPVVAYFIMQAISYLLANYIIGTGKGFSLKLICVVSIVANALPFHVFTKQERGYAMQGTIISTFVLIAAAMYYFKDQFWIN